MALDPGDGEHRGNHRQDATRPVEERQGLDRVVLAGGLDRFGKRDTFATEIVEPIEGVDNGVETCQTDKANQKSLNELAEQIAINEVHRLVLWGPERSGRGV